MKESVDKAKPKTVKQKIEIDVHGKFLGIAVFLFGIVLLCTVFYIAYSSIMSPGSIIESDPQDLFGGVISAMIKVGFLYVMGYCASWVAGRGVQMYRASKFVPEIVK
ncbi:MAG: hypothetical protein QMC78_00200 [Methanocellales archaeon]|nr:hypothetical protein [Methanocellales archaeon]